MIEIYKTADTGHGIAQLQKIERGCWINVVDPSEEELKMLETDLGIFHSFLRDPLDPEETPRIDVEEGQTLIIADIPYAYQDGKNLRYETVPMGIIIAGEYFLTICLKESTIIDLFKQNKVKEFYTFKKTRFTFQVLFQIAKDFLRYLRHIDKKTDDIEKFLHKSMRNRELFRMLQLEKSLVFFNTSLKANEIMMEKLLRGKYLRMYEEDQDLLEDVIIENKQAIEMASIYTSILNGMMGTFASVISNNLNMVMKFLASMTIVMAIPTMIASFFGMNVAIPFNADSPLAFVFILGFSAVVSGVVIYILVKKEMF